MGVGDYIGTVRDFLAEKSYENRVPVYVFFRPNRDNLVRTSGTDEEVIAEADRFLEGLLKPELKKRLDKSTASLNSRYDAEDKTIRGNYDKVTGFGEDTVSSFADTRTGKAKKYIPGNLPESYKEVVESAVKSSEKALIKYVKIITKLSGYLEKADSVTRGKELAIERTLKKNDRKGLACSDDAEKRTVRSEYRRIVKEHVDRHKEAFNARVVQNDLSYPVEHLMSELKKQEAGLADARAKRDAYMSAGLDFGARVASIEYPLKKTEAPQTEESNA